MARSRIHVTPRDHVREAMIRRFVLAEAVEIEDAVAQVGWTWPIVARACRVADSLLAVFGPGNYRLYAGDRWGRGWQRPRFGGRFRITTSAI
jgi:hypothetical protein